MGKWYNNFLLLGFLSVFIEEIVSFEGLLLKLPLSFTLIHEGGLGIVVVIVDFSFKHVVPSGSESSRLSIEIPCAYNLLCFHLLSIFPLECLHKFVLHLSHRFFVKFLY